jgi:hypothetical protein
MTIARYDNYVFDAKKFLYAEVTGTGINIHIDGAKMPLSVRTKTQTEAREKLKDIQSVVNGALDRGGR